MQSYNSRTLADEDGEYPDWIELYNFSDQAVDLAGYALSDTRTALEKWPLPQILLGPGQYLVLFASGKDRRDPARNLHTSFRIDAEGETIYLVDQRAGDVSKLEVPALYGDHSLIHVGVDSYVTTDHPSPGAANVPGVDPPRFVPEAGFYHGHQSVELQGPGEIYYTTNGADPDLQSGTLYTGPIPVTQTTVVAARCYQGDLGSVVVRNTYIIDGDTDLAVFSLSTHPDYFFDPQTGIYVKGPNAEAAAPYKGANFWQDWEKPIHVEYFDEQGKLRIELDAGVKIAGNWTRANPMKSLALYARKRYGTPAFDCDFFGKQNSAGQTISSFKSVLLRNSGNDFLSTNLRDALVSRLMEGTHVDKQAYRPVVVFLNGAYWGIHNLREKINRDYLATNHPGVDPEHASILIKVGEVLHGDNAHYLNMLEYIRAHGLADPADYAHIKTQMDVDNYIDYMIVNIFINNTDWPGNNVKYWRTDSPGSRWRWILYDTDFGLGWNRWDAKWGAIGFDSLAFALADSSKAWQNAPAVTFLFRKLFENAEFRAQFFARFEEFLETRFSPEHIIAKLDEMAARIEPEMLARNLDRWGPYVGWRNASWNHDGHWDWYAELSYVRTYATERKAHLRRILQAHKDRFGSAPRGP